MLMPDGKPTIKPTLFQLRLHLCLPIPRVCIHRSLSASLSQHPKLTSSPPCTTTRTRSVSCMQRTRPGLLHQTSRPATSRRNWCRCRHHFRRRNHVRRHVRDHRRHSHSRHSHPQSRSRTARHTARSDVHPRSRTSRCPCCSRAGRQGIDSCRKADRSVLCGFCFRPLRWGGNMYRPVQKRPCAACSRKWPCETSSKMALCGMFKKRPVKPV